MILINNFKKSFGNRILIENCNLKFNENGLYCILGKSGSGKTTLLNCILGLDLDYEGDISINGENLKSLGENELRDFRANNFGIVFQDFRLFENQTVYENLRLVINNSFGLNKEEINQKINDILEYLDIHQLKDDYVRNLSGGEKQRVALARSLMNNPKILVCDEPTGSLDEKNSQKLFEILSNLAVDKVIIVVTHDKDLAFQFSNYIFDFKNNRFFENRCKNLSNQKILLLQNKSKGLALLPLKYIWSEIKNSFKFKKARYYISSVIISISLICFGVSLFISENISRSITKAFSNIINENSLILRKKNQSQEILRFGASKEEVEDISSDYTDDIDYFGASYLNNFSEFFVDENQFYTSKEGFLKKLSFLKIQNITNFKIVDFNLYEEFKINELENDEIIIALDYVSMEKLCLNLEIVRSYESINEYIENLGLRIILKVANYDWNYEDEIIFTVKGIIKSSINNIYHTNSLFNEYVLEEVMRFPYTQYIDAKSDMPWLLYKLYYVKAKNFQATFLNKITKDKKYYKYIFDSDSYFYTPSNCKIGEQCNSNKVFIFRTINNNFDLSIIDEIKEMNSQFSNYYFSTPYGYYNYGDGIFNGFTLETYLTFDKKIMNDAIDALESIDKDDYTNLELSKIVKGYVLDTTDRNLKFTTVYDGKYEGKEELASNEIVISSEIASFLGEGNVIGKDVYIFQVYEQSENEKKLFNKFKSIRLKIGGVVDSNKFAIYQNGDFSISIFRDYFQTSSFYLIPNSVVYEFTSKPSIKEIEKINRAIPEYELIDPFSNIDSSINESFSYLNLALVILTIFSSFSSIILLFVVNTINFEEDKNEINILKILGFRDTQINKMQLCKSFSFTLPSSLFSCFSIVLLSYFLKESLTKALGLDLGYSFPLVSVIGIIILGFSITIASFIPYVFSRKIRKNN